VKSEDEAPYAKKRKAEEQAAPAAKKSKTDESVSATLFVGSLSWNTDEYGLRNAFEKFGTLKGARVMTQADSGRSKGYV
jgi:nucleolin